jgi:glycosyltransferase involved in cell wall biosynthesis
MPILSIIIPAYNVAKQIDRCLGSIINSMKQGSQNIPIEVIVVNDGSLDNTADKVNTYINDFNGKLLLINKENNGVSSARNCGIKNANGRYMYFMDADDEISQDFFSVLLPKLINGVKDVFLFGFTIVSNKGRSIYYPKATSNLLDLFLLGKQKIAIWSIVCKRDFFEGLLFDEGTYYAEDIEVISKVLYLAKAIEVINKPLYVYYINNPSSAMHKKISERNLTSIDAHRRIYQFLVDSNAPIKMKKSAKNLMLSRYYLWKKKVDKSNDIDLKNKMADYDDLLAVTPPLQCNKFYLFSLAYYCKYHYFK